jgi:hypothetical protein
MTESATIAAKFKEVEWVAEQYGINEQFHAATTTVTS